MIKHNQTIQLSYKIVTLLITTSVLLFIIAVILLFRAPIIVSNFEQCKKAGGALLETYPEQCMINKNSFTSSQQNISSNEYIGLNENDALKKAGKANTPARVVERDGNALPATMDFVFGRHNLYVKDGKVYKVEIEGQAIDK